MKSKRSSARISILFVVAIGAVSCERSSVESQQSPPSAAPQSTLVSPDGSAGKTSAAATSSARPLSDKAEDTSNVETWEGTYDAKKGEVEMPPRVLDKVRAKDDGKTALGPGKLTLTIRADNEVQGSVDGALGKATVRGKLDGDKLRCTFFPNDALDKQAMFGILEATLKNDRIKGRIRVANGDASVVRQAEFDLQKK